MSVSVKLNNKNITFTSAYCGKYSNHFISDIRSWTSFFNDDYFIIGDLNAKHNSWNNTENNIASRSYKMNQTFLFIIRIHQLMFYHQIMLNQLWIFCYQIQVLSYRIPLIELNSKPFACYLFY